MSNASIDHKASFTSWCNKPKELCEAEKDCEDYKFRCNLHNLLVNRFPTDWSVNQKIAATLISERVLL